GNAGENDPVVALVRRGTVLRIRIHVPVARAPVVAPEVEERRRSEAGLQAESLLPRLPVVLRPPELRVAGVPHPKVEDSIDHEDAAGLGAAGPVAETLSVGAQILAAEIACRS